MYHIYSLTPAPWGEHYRFVVACDTCEDAQLVLDALEKVNILFNTYKIIDMTETYDKYYQRRRNDERI